MAVLPTKPPAAGTPAAGTPVPAKPMSEFACHSAPVVALGFTPDRAIVISADRGGTVRVRNLSSSKPADRGTIPATAEQPRSVACSSAARVVALGSGTSAGLVRLFDISEGTPTDGPTLRGARGAVLALA